MKDFICKVCGYIYKPEENNNVEFNNLEDDWICPICSATKEEFEEI